MIDKFGQELKVGDPIIHSVSNILKVAVLGRISSVLHVDSGQWYARGPHNVIRWFPPNELKVGAKVIFGQGTSLLLGTLISKTASTWSISVGAETYRRKVEEIRRYE